MAIFPSRHLYLYSDSENQEFVSSETAKKIEGFFSAGGTVGLLRLGMTKFEEALPPSLAFWQQFAKLFVTEICKFSGLEKQVSEELQRLSPQCPELDTLLEHAPFMRGGEYLNAEMLFMVWREFSEILDQELVPFKGQLKDYLSAYNPSWIRVGRVCFHLAENKADPHHPFAFLATYTTQLSNTDIKHLDAKQLDVKHQPLGRALQEYSGDQKRSLLLSLLLPVQKAAGSSPFIKHLVDTGSIFHPLSWKAGEAYQFLKDIPLIEEAGVVVKVPNWWNPKRPPRPQIKVAVGNANASTVGLDALLDFNMAFALPDGEYLTSLELKNLLEEQGKLVQIKGQWVEVDRDKLNQVLGYWEKIESKVKREGLSFAEGLRLLAGTSGQEREDVPLEDVAEWSKVVEGPWLNETLTRLRHPEQTGSVSLEAILQEYLNADLRPYQQSGVHWLWWLYNLRLGGCLADDMGLGKTIQVLALLLLAKHHQSNKEKVPHLLVIPASLLGNWQSEINKFAPDLKIWIAHSSALNKTNTKLKDIPDLSAIDLVMTTYAHVHQLPWLAQVDWNMVVIDEAQSIKNPTAKQTQAIKKLPSQVRFALTGTPVENRLLDLWSLFDFIAPGLLGSSKSFSKYGKKKHLIATKMGERQDFMGQSVI